MNQYHFEGGWVHGLRIFAWVNFIVGILGGFYSAYQIVSFFSTDYFNWGVFFVFLIASLIATFITTAVIMVFLDIAADISRTAWNSDEMLKQKKYSIDYASIEKLFNDSPDATVKTPEKHWECLSCSGKNSLMTVRCAICGEARKR